jgi:hypothetical protein
MKKTIKCNEYNNETYYCCFSCHSPRNLFKYKFGPKNFALCCEGAKHLQKAIRKEKKLGTAERKLKKL